MAMTDTEALMWRLERHRGLSSTFANVALLDRRPDIDRLRSRLSAAAASIPRLRQRIDEAARAPRWVVDDHLDVDAHVRHVEVATPGTQRQLFDLVTTLAADPFDPTRPPWQFTVIDGLDDGRSALLQKVHHAITDGQGGIELAAAYLDLARNQADQHLDVNSDTVAAETPSDQQPTTTPAGAPHRDLPDDETADAVRAALAGILRVPLGVRQQVRELLTDPDSITDASRAATRTLDEVGRELSAGRAASPLWTQRSTRRRLYTTGASISALRAATHDLDGTINTAFLTAAAEAAGDYHRRVGSPVDTLRASIAVSTRTDQSGSNAFTLARIEVPTGLMPTSERFDAVATAIESGRAATPDRLVDTAAALGATLPTSLVARFARAQARSIDIATSNVRGAPVDTFVAGARVVGNVPIGPLLGVPVNLTALSQGDRFDIGVHIDPAAIEEPAMFASCLDDAIERVQTM
ncbi:MAG: wax ester/triacylglycerol synthase domain-containing protein [Actinomycetota bacterium]